MNGNNGVPGAKTFSTTTDFCKLFFFFLLHQNSVIRLVIYDPVSDNKQLLDEVFVISRIIKVEVGVISRS